VIAIQGIAAAAEAAGGLPSRADVAAAVRATENYEGLTGTITFDDNGDPEIGLYYVIEVASGDPAEWSNNSILATLEIPSPAFAASMEMMEPEATPGS
jgi:branched-chain amino acid transport system substrate-binding protein